MPVFLRRSDVPMWRQKKKVSSRKNHPIELVERQSRVYPASIYSDIRELIAKVGGSEVLWTITGRSA